MVDVRGGHDQRGGDEGVRRIAVATGAVILVVGMVGTGLAVASRRSGIVRHDVLSFAVHLVNEDAGDVGASGDSPGDTFFAPSELQNFDLTKQLGRYGLGLCPCERRHETEPVHGDGIPLTRQGRTVGAVRVQ